MTLDEVVSQLKKDPGRPVRATVGDLTIEVRAVDEQEARQVGSSSGLQVQPQNGEPSPDRRPQAVLFGEALAQAFRRCGQVGACSNLRV